MRKISVSTIFLLLSFLSKAQIDRQNVGNVECVYELTFQFDSLDTKSVRKEDMVLTIGKNTSRFTSKNHMILQDSIQPLMVRQMETTGNMDLSKMNLPRTRFEYDIIKLSDKILVYDNILGQNFKYEEPRILVKWTLSKEIRTVAGLKCQKATGSFAGRAYIAWFPTEVPISEGPYKFSGLPGLVVEIADTRNHYKFEIKKVSKITKEVKFVEPSDYVTVTKSDFFKKDELRRLNPIQALTQAASINLSADDIRRIREREKKRNNPIELKIGL